MFKHPSTVCNEQNLNSVIVKPAQGEKLTFKDAAGMDTYRVEGYAYDGGGHEIQRIEFSLDEGKTWLYCTRRFPDKPVRHGEYFSRIRPANPASPQAHLPAQRDLADLFLGSKYWTWLHW